MDDKNTSRHPTELSVEPSPPRYKSATPAIETAIETIVQVFIRSLKKMAMSTETSSGYKNRSVEASPASMYLKDA